MTDDFATSVRGEDASAWSPAAFFSPPVSSVTAFVVAVSALMGQNAVTAGLSSVLGPGFGPAGPQAFYLAWGGALVLQAVLVVLLARRALSAGGWEETLARASVLVAGLTVLAGLLVILGGLANQQGLL